MAEGKKGKRPRLPDSCAGCVYFVEREHLYFDGPMKNRCHRRAPSPGEETGQLLFSYAPEVPPEARCGAGADRLEPGKAALVLCGDCKFWWQPDGFAPQPRFMNGKPREWWARTGYCIPHSPYQTSDPRRKAAWPVKHADDSCGDGEHWTAALVEAEEDELAEENL